MIRPALRFRLFSGLGIVPPSALEFMERRGVEWVVQFDNINFDLKDGIEAFLLIEVDGNNQDVIFSDCEKINDVLEQHDCKEVIFADSSAQKEELWRLRRTMSGFGKIALGFIRRKIQLFRALHCHN